MKPYWFHDGVWIAIDAAGHVAVLTTAGVAPVPSVVLESYNERWIEAAIKSSPIRCDCDLQVQYPRPDDYIAFAERGYFAYDWQDVHRTCEFTRSYELIAVPKVPIFITDLQQEILQLARIVTLTTITFSRMPTLAIEKLIPCRTG